MKILSFIILLYSCSIFGQKCEIDKVFPSIRGISGIGDLSLETLNSIDSIDILISAFNKDSYDIVEFTLNYRFFRGFGMLHSEIWTNLKYLSQEQKEVIKSLKINDKIYLQGVRIKCADSIYTLNGSAEITVSGPQACLFRLPNNTQFRYLVEGDDTTRSDLIRSTGEVPLYNRDGITIEQFTENNHLFVYDPFSSRTETFEGLDIKSRIIKYDFLYLTDDGRVGEKIHIDTDEITIEIKKIVNDLRPEKVMFENVQAIYNDQIYDIGSLKLDIWK